MGIKRIKFDYCVTLISTLVLRLSVSIKLEVLNDSDMFISVQEYKRVGWL